MNSFLILEAANLRKEPSVNSEKVGLLSSGVVVHFTETIASDNRVWIRISEYNAWTVEENGYHLPDNYKENDFLKSMIFILKWEGGYVNDPNDPGGETKYGISKRSFPDLDIANLNLEKALDIYLENYWIPSNSNNLEWPLNLVHFNFSINAGLSAASNIFVENVNEYLLKQKKYYESLSLFKIYGKSWLNRLEDLQKHIT